MARYVLLGISVKCSVTSLLWMLCFSVSGLLQILLLKLMIETIVILQSRMTMV